jgi:hypothetical protein
MLAGGPSRKEIEKSSGLGNSRLGDSSSTERRQWKVQSNLPRVAVSAATLTFCFTVEHFPLIQSLLFSSPYSGCPGFSGWPLNPCPAPAPSAYWPAQRNAPGARMSVDLYRPGWAERRVPKILSPPKYGPPRATVTLSAPLYNLRPIAGPSATGPFTYRGPWNFEVGGLGAVGQGFGLT